MLINKFCHLHLHTHYSLLDGLTKPSLLMKRLNELGMDSVAITDHGNMHGAVEFYKEAKANGIKPIIGCEVYICNDRTKKTLINNEIHHLTLLCMNHVGYKNLIQLVSQSNLDGFYYKPRIDFELLKKYNEGLICLSGCLGGELSQLILQNKKKEALALSNKYLELFGDRYYIELQVHPRNIDQGKVTPLLIRLAKKINIPVVATGDSHYLCKEDSDTHDVLLAVNTGTNLDDKNRFSLKDSDIYVSSPDEMAKKFEDIPEAIINTQVIANRCNLEIELNKIKLPAFEVPKGYTPDTYIRLLCQDGLKNIKYDDSQEYKNRLEYELDVIQRTGFATYLLIVEDMISWAKNNNIAVGPGRGSAAGSLICYCLGITDVDPIQYGLLFERFLNPERIAPPDIDMDFEDTRRSEVIDYVTNKYGKDHVAQIATFGTMFARSSIRDAGRAMGYDLGICDKIAKMIPFMQSLGDALEGSKELQIEYRNPESRRLIDMAIKLEGVVRHVGTHACGIVISDKPITDYMPVMLSKEGNITAQYDMNIIGDLGLLKMDFLGLRNLSVISNTQNLIKEDLGEDIDVTKVPLGDKNTFKLLQMAKTTSVFQLESGGMKKYLKDLKPTNIDDITAMVSLYRPGPMELIPEYISRKYNRSPITYLHPSLEPVLKDTYGIMIYQEQLIKAVQVLAGFSLAEADVLRKAVGKKIKKLLDEQEGKFKEGCKNNNISDYIANDFWDLIEPFNRYGFNKCLKSDTKVDIIGIGGINIKDVKPGSLVWCVEDGERVEAEVVALHDNGVVDMVEIEFDGGIKETCSLNHKWLTNEGKKTTKEIIEQNLSVWFDATKQLADEVPKNWNIYRRIIRATPIGPQRAFDLEVSSTSHNFILSSGLCTSNSHAVCYAMIGYYTAYLKANYPLQFMTAELNSGGDIERIKELMAELKDMGIKVSPPNINDSEANFSSNKNIIHFGLSSVKGMNTKVIDAIIVERNNGRFKSLSDFLIRIGSNLNKKVVSLLSQSGAVDDWGNRADINIMTDSIVAYGKTNISDTLPPFFMPTIPPPTIGQKLSWEKELLGMYVSANPARNYYDTIKQRGTVDIDELGDLIGKKVKIGGIITHFKKKVIKNKRVMYIMKLMDITGELEVAIFSGVYDKYSEVLKENNVIIIFGSVQEYNNSVKISPMTIVKIDSLT